MVEPETVVARELPDVMSGTARRTRPLANISHLATSNIVGKVFSFAFLFYAAHTLSKGILGDYYNVLSYVGLFGIVGDLGLSTLAVRDVAQDRSLAVRYVSNIVAVRALLSAASLVVIGALAQIIMRPSLRDAVYIYALALVPIAVSNTLGLVFQFSERLAYNGALSVASAALQAILGIAVIYTGHHNVRALVIAYTVGMTINVCISIWVVYTRFLPRWFELDLRWWPVLVRGALPFSVLTLINVLYNYADRQILQIMSGCIHNPGCAVVAEYTLAYRPLDILTAILIGGVNAAMLPAFNRVVVESREALRRVVYSACTLALAVGVPAALLVAVYAPEALRIVGGRQYLDAAPAAAILIWTFPCILVLSMLYNALYAIHRQNVVAVAFAVTLVFNVVANVLLIPHFSYVASAAITVGSEVINGVIVLTALRRSLGPSRLGLPTAKIALVTLVAVLPLWYLRVALHSYSIFIGLPLGILIVLGGLRITHFLGQTEREALKRVPLLGRYAHLL